MTTYGPDKWRRLRLGGVSGLAAFLLTLVCGAPALAQDENQGTTGSTASSNAPIEEIVTTGSRIRRTEFSAPQAIQVLNMEVATLGGLVEVGDILQESTMAANAPQWNNLWTGYVVTGGGGTNSIDLRGLGDGKTLVLLNGRRLNPAGTRGTVSQVDLNTIPTSIVQRIEVLKDGASSVYGSDAVAGVVNIITRKNVEGISGSLSRSAPFDGGGEITTADLSIGFSDGGSSFIFGADFLEREALVKGDRKWASCMVELYRDPDTGEDLSTIDPATGQRKCVEGPANDYIINYGRYYTTGGADRHIWDPQGGSTDWSDPANWRIGSYAERKFDHPSDDHTTVVSPVRRASFFSFGNWDIDSFGSGTAGYYEFLYNSRRSEQNGGPRQLGLDVNDSPFSPFFNAGGWAYDIPLLLPYEQTNKQEVNWMRSLVGLTGNAGANWSWDVNVGYGRSHGSYSSPQMLVDRIVNSLDVVQVGGEWDCYQNQYDVNFSDTGSSSVCVPFNPYQIIAEGRNSPGLFPQDLLDYIVSVETGETTYAQKTLSGYFTGELFNMPAGPVGAVIGVEYREESINDVPSSGSINSNLWGYTSSGITKGTDKVKELFGELEFPLLRGATAAEELTFSLAGRYSDYETGYSDTTYRVGLNWQIVDWLRLRSAYGTSFRAPSLYENFLGGQTAFTSASDPCESFGADNQPGDPIYENCLAETGDPGFPGYSNTPQVITYGNAGRLSAETSKSQTVGLIVETPIDLSFALDFFEFTINDEIDRFGADSILSQCYNLPTSQFRQPGTICDFITPRDPTTGEIRQINDSYFNINEKYQKGYDLTVRYQFGIGDVDFVADLRGTVISDFYQDLFGGEQTEYNGLIGWPKKNGQLDLTAVWRDWTFYYGLDYIGPQSDYNYYDEDPATSIYVLDVPSVVYHDLAIRYDADGWAAQVGVQNIGNKEPPMVSDWDTYGWAGNAAPYTGYDMRGRTYFFNLQMGF